VYLRVSLDETQGQLTSRVTSLSFQFNAYQNQSVSVIVIPLIQEIGNVGAPLSDFDIDLEITTPSKKIPSRHFSSHSRSSLSLKKPVTGYIDTIVCRAVAGDELRVTVSAVASRLSQTENWFRLFVVGDGFLEGTEGSLVDVDRFNHQNVFGSHIING
jgi:hypothetical protein